MITKTTTKGKPKQSTKQLKAPTVIRKVGAIAIDSAEIDPQTGQPVERLKDPVRATTRVKDQPMEFPDTVTALHVPH